MALPAQKVSGACEKRAPGFRAINKVNVYQTEGGSYHFEPGTDQMFITEKSVY